MGNLHDHVNEDGKLYSEIDEHIEELEEFFAEDGDCELANEVFEEKVWEDLDEALHNSVFAHTFQEKLYNTLIQNYAEAVHCGGVKDTLMSLLKDME